MKFKQVYDYNRLNAQKGIDFTHQGGATCKFSGHFTVKLVRRKNVIFRFLVPTEITQFESDYNKKASK